MPGTAVVGLQWGDEGKGKVIDAVASTANLVVRYQGGANAGHTVHAGGKKYVFHLVPTGLLHPGVRGAIGPGVVVDAPALVAELDELEREGVPGAKTLLVSDRAHVVFPYHKSLDEAREGSSKSADSGRIGTTKRGIGPCYADKASRTGIRIADLYDRPRFERLLERNLAEKNAVLKHLYGHAPLDLAPIRERYLEAAERLKRHVGDVPAAAQEALARGEKVLFEGAQGVMLDLDHGTYPYVTSSSTGTDGIAAGAGVPPTAVRGAVGVLKAYTTRVGEGPFPSEIEGELGKKLRDAGGEYGATTGRPRRCGWLDLVQLRHAIALTGVNGLILTKLDVLAGMGEIKVCVAYEVDGKRHDRVPAELSALERAKPVLESFPGFPGAGFDGSKWDDLPKGARAYIEEVEKRVGVPVLFISTGPERGQMIARRNGASVWS
jgi:adenylosuccinate synthase